MKRRHRLAISCRGRKSPKSEDVLKIPTAVMDYLCGFHSRSVEKNTSAEISPPGEWEVVRRKKNRTGNIREVVVLPWHLEEHGAPFTIGKVEKRGRKRQLLMEVIATAGREKLPMKVLIDTGAQANLVRRDLFPPECLRPARKPLALSTVSGEALPGGQQEVKLKLLFSAETDTGKQVPECWTVEAVLHDAEIGCDAILGYEWLAENMINVKAWSDALQLDRPPRYILKNLTPSSSVKKSKGPSRVEEIAAVAMAEAKVQPLPANSKGVDLEVDDAEDEEDEEYVTVDEVRKLRLSMPMETESDGEQEDVDVSDEEITDDEALAEVARVLTEVEKETRKVQGVILAEDEVQSPLAKELQEALLRDYADTVFRGKLWPDPPVRGTHGPAKLCLKPGAKPVTGRVIMLPGPRLEAMRELEAENKGDNKVEPGSGPWRAVAFPINKKNGKWRGVVDYNRTNQEIQDDSYPLPQIPHLLVEQDG